MLLPIDHAAFICNLAYSTWFASKGLRLVLGLGVGRRLGVYWVLGVSSYGVSNQEHVLQLHFQDSRILLKKKKNQTTKGKGLASLIDRIKTILSTVCLCKNLPKANFYYSIINTTCICVCMCAQKTLFSEGNMPEVHRITRQHRTNYGTFLNSKKIRNSLAFCRLTDILQMSWDRDHLDKDIPIPTNKIWTKNRKNTPPLRHKPRSQMIEGYNARRKGS